MLDGRSADLGLGRGNSVLRFIGVAFLLVPLFFYRYRGWLRESFAVKLWHFMLRWRYYLLERLNNIFLGGSCLGSLGADLVSLNIVV
jgi:hypothetical protein